MFSQKEENFSYDECSFNVQKTKESTARVVMSKQGIQNSYTLECSFWGPTGGKYQDWHFNPPILKSMGREFCLNLLQYRENTKLVKECYSLILDSFENEQAALDSKFEMEKRPSNNGKKSKGKLQSHISLDSSNIGANSSTKKRAKGKNLKKSTSTSDKKRSHSAELKQLKPAKKKSAVSQSNSKPVKPKKKK